MKLYYSSTSPFVRKVNVFAIEADLEGQIERVTTNPWQAEDLLVAENPLSKIPTLITNDGMVLYDSGVICSYLDTLHTKQKLIPENKIQHWQVLRMQALCDGILEAGILRFMEAKRDKSLQSGDWDAMQKNAVTRGLAYLESQVDSFNGEIDLGLISLGCLLGWLDFRFAHENWRQPQPKLAGWFEQFSQRPSMKSTVPVLC